MVIYLEIWGKNFPVDEFLREHDELQTVVVWREGEPGLRGKIQQSSGLKLEFGDGSRLQEAIGDYVSRLQALAGALTDARRLGAALCLDLGLIVSPDRPMRTLHIPNKLLTELAKQNIDIQVSGYAASGKQSATARGTPS